MKTATKKITKATVKSFIKNNIENLYINVTSDFDGMTDCVEQVKGGFKKAEKTEDNISHNLGMSSGHLLKSILRMLNS